MRRTRISSPQIDQARREALLATATSVFARRGFDAPAMDQLAAACNCDRRTLYRYFPSKEDLFWAVVERAYTMLASRFRNVAEVWVSGRLPALARVRSWIFAYFTFSLENPEAFRLIMEGRQKSVADSQARSGEDGKPIHEQLGHSGDSLAALDRSVLATLAGLGKQLEIEGACRDGTGDEQLWELLGISIGLIEFHARYRGGGAGMPFGTPEGIQRMLERQISAAFGPEERKK